jgi:spermidine synthase
MSALFEELERCPTPIGTLSLRRRRDLTSGGEVYEIKLGDSFLMSSAFTVAEVELARLGLAASAAPQLDVIVGGLGLGYTADAVLDDARITSLTVVEALPEVVAWHRRGLLPLGARLTSDPRCRLVHGDFFAIFGPSPPAGDVPAERRYHAILVDIDHSPRNVLSPGNAALYTPDGLRRIADRLHPGGVFALWSNDPPDAEFQAALGDTFSTAEARVVAFANSLRDSDATNTVYVATRAVGTAASA